MKTGLNKRHLQVLLLLLAIGTLMTGCITFDFPKLSGDIGTLIAERLVAGAQNWLMRQRLITAAVESGRPRLMTSGPRAALTLKRREISNILATIQVEHVFERDLCPAP